MHLICMLKEKKNGVDGNTYATTKTIKIKQTYQI